MHTKISIACPSLTSLAINTQVWCVSSSPFSLHSSPFTYPPLHITFSLPLSLSPNITMEIQILPVKTPSSSARKNSYRLETKNLTYKLCTQFNNLNWVCCDEASRKNPKFILKSVNCEAGPGEITAIAGSSGAGKTTLLEILAGKISKVAAGQVLVNDQPMDAKIFRRISGYVTQNDELFPLLTVQETLTYTARLRLPGDRKEAGNRVNGLMKELGLEHVADSRNGGISGGERRRVSIGVDLVHDPAVLLIDEPTSGLDSASALHVISLLRSVAVNQGKTIVLTIHQPGFRALQLFDRIVLLSEGFVFHNGSLNLLEQRLKFAGHSIPHHVNVLEFAIDVSLSMQSSAAFNFLELKNIQENKHCEMRIVDEKLLSYPNSRFEEVIILGQRFCSNIIRTKQLFAARIMQSLVAGLILGTVFLNVGNDEGGVALQTWIGFFAFGLTFLLSSTTEGLPIFLQERGILLRETSRGAYRVSSYVFANTVVFIPFLLMFALLYATPVYWLVGLRRSVDGFLYFSLVVWMVVLMANSFVACFSALVPNFIMGNSVIAGLMGSFFLFSGYFISEKNIPDYWIFMHYLSLFKYPFECFILNEFGGEEGMSRCIEIQNGECKLYGSGFLRQQGLMEAQKWSNLAVMLSFIVGYRMLCFLILWCRCYKTRN